MVKRKRFTGRTMGKRSVSLTLTLSVDSDRKITDRAWSELQDVIDEFVEALDQRTIFTVPVVQEVTYNREVEVREPLEYA